MNSDSITTKINRLRSGAKPRVLDLFSGCGGLSLGFEASGYRILGAVEVDSFAAASHNLNFHDEGSSSAEQLARDITQIEADELLAAIGEPGPVAESVDVIVGGPPCQAFARVGRAKLREVREHPAAFKLDPRSNLYLRYLKYVEQLKPLALLMENVPDIINFGGHNVAEETCDVLTSMGYVARYTLLNSVYYGVPQTRERMFLIAYAKELGKEVQFPGPTHWFSLPKGYEGTRRVALKYVRGRAGHQLGLLPDNTYVPPPEASSDLTPAVTAHEALHDLPPVTEHLTQQMSRGARRLNDFVAYRPVRPSRYAHLMRTWVGFEGQGGVYDHAIRSLSARDFEIFRRMRPGDQYPEARRIAMVILEEECAKLSTCGGAGSRVYEELKRRIVPPYDPSKFPNKWRKMSASEPARTLMAHLGKDSYSHIHYDSSQARTISVREAARLMSFPDGFRFCGTMNPAFRQIGNAVPPLMAAALARVMMQAITGAIWTDESLLSA